MSSGKSLHFKGNGTGYLYYIGYCVYLKNHFDLGKMTFSGCSSGAFTATLLALDIDPVDAVVLPFQSQAKRFSRFALIGNWKAMFRRCLERMLSESRDYRQLEHLEIGVQYLDKSELIDRFESKQDLIACLLSSTHIPFLVNFRPFDKYKGKFCLDAEVFSRYSVPEGRHRISYELSARDKFSPKTEPELFRMISDGYFRAMSDESLLRYLRNRQSIPISEAPLFEFLQLLKAELVKSYDLELSKFC